MRGADRLVAAVALLLASTAAAGPQKRTDDDRADVPKARALVDLTRGLRFDPPLTAIAVAPSDPRRVYVGNDHGLVFASRDGGRTWTESRLHVPPGRFSGAAHPAAIPEIEGMSIPDAPTAQPSPWNVFDFVELEEEFQATPDPSDFVIEVFEGGLDGTEGPWWADDERVTGVWGFDDDGGERAERLGAAIEDGGGFTPGWGRLKALDEVEPGGIGVEWLEVDEKDADVVWAATDDGLLRSDDGGDSWLPIYEGALPDDRRVNDITVDEHDPRLVWMGTGAGLYVSRDGGATFHRSPDALAGDADCWWIEPHPTDPKILYIGTSNGLIRTRDGGRTFDFAFVGPYRPQNEVGRVLIDSENPKRVYIGTGDGIFVSEDGGDHFQALGGLLFSGQTIVVLDEDDGKLLAGTSRDLWESDDHGRTWRTLYFGEKQWGIRNVVTADDGLWILTDAEVLRLMDRAPSRVSDEAVAEFRALSKREPSVGEAVEAALHHFGASVAEQMAARGRARWAAAMPVVDAGAVLRDYDLKATQFDRESSLDQATARSTGPLRRFAWSVVGTWDLQSLVHSPDEAPAGDAFDAARQAEQAIRGTVMDLFEERRRLQLDLLADPPRDPRARLMWDLRMEELTAHLNALTGGLFAPAPAW